MPDDLTPGSPLWWVRHLENILNARAPKLELFEQYYSGEHRMGFTTVNFRNAFGALFADFADNWCDLVVDAVEERLNVEGFRLGRDATGDRKAWRIWQSNQLDADSQLAHTEALIAGESHALVWADADGNPRITIEHAQQMAVAYAAGSRRVRSAALKRWAEDDGYAYATLYLPDVIYKFRSQQPTPSYAGASPMTGWVERSVPGEAWPLPNPLGVVPVVPIVNRPRLLKAGASEIAQVIPVQDAVNATIRNMLVAGEFTAAPQRWATGIEIPKNPITGEPVAVFEHMVNRMWTSNSAATEFGQFPQASLQPFVAAVEMLVQHIASQTRTPPHYFYLSGQFPSGESIKSAETGLVAKAVRKQRHFGEAWEEVMRLAFAVMGDRRRASITDSQVIWGDAESRSESEHVDAIVKLKALNVPNQILWERAGFSPQEIERMIALGALEAPSDPVAVSAMADAGVSADIPPA